MGRYDRFSRAPARRRLPVTHPIWRGIGCLIIVIVPLLSFGLAYLLVNYAINQEWPIPYQLIGTPRLPGFIWQVPALARLFQPVLAWENMYAYLLATLLMMLILGALLSLVYAVLYSMIGPPRYSPLDEPPIRGVKVKPYKR